MVRPATGNSIDLDEALRARIMVSAERLLKVMPVAAKKIAIESVDLPEFMLNLARGIPATQVDNPDIVEELGRTIAFKRQMMAAAGQALSAESVRKLLGHKTVQAVYKAARERRLLMLDDGGVKLFPSFQFDGNSVRPAIPQLLAAAPRSSGWAILQFLVGGEPASDGRRRIDLIKGTPEEIDLVVRFARTLDD
ncbi:hypothetical protein [Sphingobium estronivorans]|uniref:hypothetical protein n=1 Tax=Sphingobium estronivorans TaxID=1577690 RepID=UPI0013C2D937|nr:hypothetical protein [Sphingobium estronivorans]